MHSNPNGLELTSLYISCMFRAKVKKICDWAQGQRDAYIFMHETWKDNLHMCACNAKSEHGNHFDLAESATINSKVEGFLQMEISKHYCISIQ